MVSKSAAMWRSPHHCQRPGDQIRQSDSVIIMGHRQSDLDAIGSAIGLLRMCKMCDVPSVIAVRSKATLAGQLLDVFNKAGEDHNFIEPEETYKLITPKTLLIVTDTYQKRLLEDQKIYEKCSRVVVIDHHRMAVGHIDNPILLYHEPLLPAPASWCVNCCNSCPPKTTSLSWKPRRCCLASCWIPAVLRCMSRAYL